MHAAQYPGEAHVDRVDMESPVVVHAEQDIGDSGETVAGDVDDLGVEDFASQEEFVISQSVCLECTW